MRRRPRENRFSVCKSGKWIFGFKIACKYFIDGKLITNKLVQNNANKTEKKNKRICIKLFVNFVILKFHVYIAHTLILQ